MYYLYFPLLISISLLLVFPDYVYSQNKSRTIVYDSPPPAFMHDEAQLNELIDGLKCSLSSDSSPEKLGQYFFDAPLAKQYIAYLEGEGYPQINQNFAPVFVQWSSVVKQTLSGLAGKVNDIEIVATKQRYGTDSSMKIVAPTLNFLLKDGSFEQFKLMLIDVNGYYRILNFED
ncbi:MAG: hypothetical protein IPM47_12250 [Sphingobacteriales bacterium]|nr:MAG: hypothetical protein IPM47_12250 [Sphingobacteriales bacterium]